MLRMCESTDGCGCIQIHRAESDQNPNHSWSMHKTSALGGEGAKVAEDWSIIKVDEASNHPQMSPQPGATLTKKCYGDAGDVATFITTKTVAGNGACIPNCE